MLLSVHKTKVSIAVVFLMAVSFLFFYVDIARLNNPHREELTYSSNTASKVQEVDQNDNGYFKPNNYFMGKKVPLLFDKIRSTKKPNLKPIPYYDLPFTCYLSEDDDEEEYRPVHANLMDVLTFKRLWASPTNMHFGYNKHCQVICEREIDSNTVDKLTNWIDLEYQYYWYIDDNLAGSTVNAKKNSKQAGFPIGYRDKNRDYYLHTHFSFVIKYENNSFVQQKNDANNNEIITQDSVQENNVIVGFEVEPISLDSYKCPTYSTDYNKFKLVKRDNADVIPYTFSVIWQQVEKTNGKSNYPQRWSNIPGLDESKKFSKGSMELVLCCSLISAYVLFMLSYLYCQSVLENEKICSEIIQAHSSSHSHQGSNFETVFHKISFLFGLQSFALLVAGVIVLSSIFKKHTISYENLWFVAILLACGSATSSLLGTFMSSKNLPTEKTFAKKGNDKFILWASFVYGISLPLVLTVSTKLIICIVELLDQPGVSTLPFVQKFHLRYLLTSFVICFVVGLFCKGTNEKKGISFILKKVKSVAHEHDSVFNRAKFSKSEAKCENQEFGLTYASFIVEKLRLFFLWCFSGLIKFLFGLAFFQVLFVGKQTFSSVDQTSYMELVAKMFLMIFFMFIVNSSINITVLLSSLQKSKHQGHWKLLNFFMTYSSFPLALGYAIYYALQIAQVTDLASITFYLFYVGVVMNICFHSALYFLSTLVNLQVLKIIEKSIVEDEYARYEEA